MLSFAFVSLLATITAAKNVPDIGFELDTYLGRWYQVAGIIALYTANCTSIFAGYSLKDNGTVQVNNNCEARDRPVKIHGTATPADPEYGAAGVFRIQFPGEKPSDCPGPNYYSVHGMSVLLPRLMKRV
ncbi:uncharacterized protein P884DRAFT_288343 [Thermothelomyces heterothallicus CBS 202.75]|uniref:uncharacterized protein n=1 Tax=Thermothelomyces heterothallicus CBS 202.75 TaxID=1149848 RepID=UPI0037449E27